MLVALIGAWFSVMCYSCDFNNPPVCFGPPVRVPCRSMWGFFDEFQALGVSCAWDEVKIGYWQLVIIAQLLIGIFRYRYFLCYSIPPAFNSGF